MLIRSQGKESIVNFDNIASIDIIGFRKTSDGYFQEHNDANVWKVTYTISEEILYLAEYSDKEKAIKVLDMIQNAYYENCYAKFMTMENYNFKTPIFQMPQESEVE